MASPFAQGQPWYVISQTFVQYTKTAKTYSWQMSGKRLFMSSSIHIHRMLLNQCSLVLMVVSEGEGLTWTDSATGQKKDAFSRCESEDGLTAFVPFNTQETYPVIIICPYFFTAPAPKIYGDLPPAPLDAQPASNCLSVSTVTNRFKKTTPRSLKEPTGYPLIQF